MNKNNFKKKILVKKERFRTNRSRTFSLQKHLGAVADLCALESENPKLKSLNCHFIAVTLALIFLSLLPCLYNGMITASTSRVVLKISRM